MTVPRCRFDESLPRLVGALSTTIGDESLSNGVVLRDVSGRLAFFESTRLAPDVLDRAADALRARLGVYARPDRLIVPRDAPGAEAVLTDPDVRSTSIGSVTVRLLDRRIVGSDWLLFPAEPDAESRRLVFTSFKGGVGRSTALSIVAADHARRGHNVLVIDLDLEAPGVGTFLLPSDRRPMLGSLDYLVEHNLGNVDSGDLDLFVGTSPLTSGAGLVDVVPVTGTQALTFPENYLAKLSRAMVEEVNDGTTPLADKLHAMVRDLESRRRYDLVLIDARAGLAELAAGSFLRFGGQVMLFGTAQVHTLEGLRFLFTHLASLVREGQSSPWRSLKMVHAKAKIDKSQESFRDDLWNLFSDTVYEEQEGLEGFNFAADDPTAPHFPVVIPLDTTFADWDPASDVSKIGVGYYSRTFGALLAYVDDHLETLS